MFQATLGLVIIVSLVAGLASFSAWGNEPSTTSETGQIMAVVVAAGAAFALLIVAFRWNWPMALTGLVLLIAAAVSSVAPVAVIAIALVVAAPWIRVRRPGGQMDRDGVVSGG